MTSRWGHTMRRDRGETAPDVRQALGRFDLGAASLGQSEAVPTGERTLSRRGACLFLGAAVASAACAGLTGCGSASSDTRTGFASDCEVKSYPLTLKIIADTNLERGFANAGGLGRVEEYFERYQGQTGRGEVTFAIKYIDSVAMAVAASSGFEECDGVIGLAGTVDLAVSQGTLDGGAADTSVRKFSTQLYEQSAVVRARGTSFEMPQASTATGEDSQDGTYNRIQNLPQFDGRIAIAADSMIEGVMANRVLARQGLYTQTTGIGGEYADSIRDKITVYDSVESIVAALTSKKSDIAFLAKSCTWGDYPSIESIYDPSFSTTMYYGAATENAAEPGVVRDFFEFITRCS